MSPRNTTTGSVLERMILPSLERSGYKIQKQVNIGLKLGYKRRHFVDAVAEKNGAAFLVSLKWQQVGGTAEEKVPFEVISLMSAVTNNESKYKKAYLILGGEGWTLRDFYVSGGLDKYLKHAETVEILKLETFIAVANKGEL